MNDFWEGVLLIGAVVLSVTLITSLITSLKVLLKILGVI